MSHYKHTDIIGKGTRYLSDSLKAVDVKAVKFDQAKADLSIVPLSGIEAVARGFMFGAGKYGSDNYRSGMESHRLIAACLRHIFAWQQGENNDSESNLSHLSHAAVNLFILLETERLGTLQDTRTGGKDAAV